ncbi:MAG: KR domain-containing protein, partial [Pseudomonadota bacterium]
MSEPEAAACFAPEHLARFLDERLDEAECIRISAHLDECEVCRATLASPAQALSGARPDADAAESWSAQGLDAVRARLGDGEVVGVQERYARLAEEHGMHRGSFQTVRQVWRAGDEVLGRLEGAADLRSHLYHVHPAVLDGMFQLVGFVSAEGLGSGPDASAGPLVPARIESLRFHRSHGRRFAVRGAARCGALFALGRLRHAQPGRSSASVVMDFDLYDGDTGAVIMQIRGFHFMRLREPRSAAALQARPQLPVTGWYSSVWVRADDDRPESGVALSVSESVRAPVGVVQLGDAPERGAAACMVAACEEAAWSGDVTHLRDADECRAWLRDCGGHDDDAAGSSGAGAAAGPVLVVLAMTCRGSETPAIGEASTQLLQVLRCAADAKSVRVVLVSGGSQGPHLPPRAEDGGAGAGAGAGESSTEAGLWSLMRTARHELTAAGAQAAGRQLWCIDVDDLRAGDSNGARRVWACVAREIGAAPSATGGGGRSGTDWEVAYERGVRYVRRIRLAGALSGAGPAEEPAVAWQQASRDAGVHIITGGLGGLGVVTAEVLAETGRASAVVLVSRSGRVKWDGQGLAERLARLGAQPAGSGTGTGRGEAGAGKVRVEIESCDVGDEDEVRELLRRVRERLGPVRGIWHAAGVVADGLIRSRQGADEVVYVTTPKALGAWHLHT